MNTPINVLVLGGGGREHAIVRALWESNMARVLHCAPGNPGIAKTATCHKIDPCDASALLELCRTQRISLVVVGPETPLVAGVADVLRADGIPVFGPGAAGARLEGSKSSAKDFMRRHNVPTADFDICTTLDEARAALSRRTPPYVIKADGLAAGKGVFLPGDDAEAVEICRTLLDGTRLGDAGRTLVIEDFMPGRELTVFALTDGKTYRLLLPSRDHKRIFEGDRGPNTGGMGAYSPVTIPDDLIPRVEREVLRPTLDGLRADGIDYKGVLYMGLMLTENEANPAAPKISVVEYNVRFGDPETQAVLPLYRGDFAETAYAVATGLLDRVPDTGCAGCALCVVLASGGYPDDTYRRGLPISGLDDDLPGTYVYHAGTKEENGTIVTSGGRVLAVTGVGETFKEAKKLAYARIAGISFEGMQYRRDIGWSEE